MRSSLLCLTLCAAAFPALAQDTPIYRCVDGQGTLMLTDRPCETPQPTAQAARPVVVKEHFQLPPSEQGRQHWVRKAPLSVPPKVDVETLRTARQTLDLQDKLASAR